MKRSKYIKISPLYLGLWLFLSFPSLDSRAQNSSTFIDRFHQKLYQNNHLYKYLYRKFWAVDTNQSDTGRLKESEFFVIPFATYSPESSYKFGLAGVYSFFTHKDRITRISSQSLRVSYSVDNQAKIEFSPDFWTPYNKTHFTGYMYLASFPSYFYGIGNNTRDSNQILLQSKQVYMDLEAEKEIFQHFRLGLTLTLIGNTYNPQSNQGFFQKFPGLYAQSGGSAYFTGISLIYDTRDRINFTTRGSYYRLNPAFSFHGISNLNSLGEINFTSIQYFPLGRKTTLGLNLVANTIFGSQVPFFLLNNLGGSNIERGYYSGRYRDKSLLEGQLEFKYHFIPRLALAVFGGTGTTWGYTPFSISQFKPSLGGGLHYIFSVPNQLSLRFDYGIGDKPAGESRSHGFYFSLAEAF
jgi:outer membrane protein assembly factor BamA